MYSLIFLWLLITGILIYERTDVGLSVLGFFKAAALGVFALGGICAMLAFFAFLHCLDQL